MAGDDGATSSAAAGPSRLGGGASAQGQQHGQTKNGAQNGSSSLKAALPSMSSNEVDYLVYSYLVESGYTHSSFSLLHESALLSPEEGAEADEEAGEGGLDDSAGPNGESGGASEGANGSGGARKRRAAVLKHVVPPGHLIRILHKGLLYLEAEARYRGDPAEPAPRLVGYRIPDSAPLAPLPKRRPARFAADGDDRPGSTRTSTNGKRATAAPSSLRGSTMTPEPVASTSASVAGDDDAAAAATSKKGKSKATGDQPRPPSRASNKRKLGTGSDEAEGSPAPGPSGAATSEAATSTAPVEAGGSKRARTSSSEQPASEKGKERDGPATDGQETAPGRAAGDEMDVDRPEDGRAGGPSTSTAGAPAGLAAPTLNVTKRSASPVVVRRGNSPSTIRRPSGPTTPGAMPVVVSTKKKLVPQQQQPPVIVSNGVSKRPGSSSSAADFGERRVSDPDLKKRRKDDSAPPRPVGRPPKLKHADPDESKAMGSASSTQASKPAAPTPSLEQQAAEARALGARVIDATDATVFRFQGHSHNKVQPCSWNSKVPSMLATGGNDSTCRIWDVPAPRPFSSDSAEGPLINEHIVCKHQSAQRKAEVTVVAWDPSGSLLATGCDDGIARIWTPSGDLHLVLSMHQRGIVTLRWNPQGTQLLTASLDNTVCLWSLNSGRVQQSWTAHSDAVLDVDWRDDSFFVSASMDKNIHLCQLGRPGPVHRFKGHKDEVNNARFSPCGTLVASASDDQTVRVWSLIGIAGVPFSAEVTERERGRLIDDADGANGTFVLTDHTQDVHTLVWAPQHAGQPRMLATAAFDNTAKLWNADDGTCLHTFDRHIDTVFGIAFRPRVVAVGEAAEGAEKRQLFATGSSDGRVCVWDVLTHKLVMEYTHTGGVYEIAWHPTRDQLAVCGGSDTVGVASLIDL